MMEYQEFLRTKIEVAPVSGFELDPSEIHPALKPHQRDAVVWALRGGLRKRYAALGNSVAIPCVEHIMAGIIELSGGGMI